MTKEAYLALAAAHYDGLRAIGQEPDFYTLEEQFEQLWTVLGRSGARIDAGAGASQQAKKTASRPASGA